MQPESNQSLQDGFLSPQLEDWRLGVCASMPEWIRLVTRVNNTALEMMQKIGPQGTSAKEMFAAALFARGLQSFEASVLLAERGMLADAETLGRSVVETAFFLGGLALIPNFHQQMAAANNHHYARMATGISGMLGKSDDCDDRKEAEDLKKLADEAKNQGYQFKPIDMKDLAEKVGMEKLYQVVYRQLSGESAHPSITSIERHFSRRNGAVENLTFSPQRDGVEKALSASIAAVLFAMEAVCEIFEFKETVAVLNTLTTTHVNLSDGLNTRLDAGTHA